MDDALLDVVLARLDQVPLEGAAEQLLLAACDSEAGPRPDRDRRAQRER